MNRPTTLKHLLWALVAVIGAFVLAIRWPAPQPAPAPGQLVATDTATTTRTETKPAPPIYVTVNLPAPQAPHYTEPAPVALTPAEAGTIGTYLDTVTVDTLHVRLTAITRTRVQGKLLERRFQYTINTDSLIRHTTTTITNTVQAPERLKLYAGAFSAFSPSGPPALGPQLTLTTPAGIQVSGGLDAAGWLRTGAPGYAISAGTLLRFRKK